MSTTKPVIFISYAHADEPDKPGEGEFAWLSFVQRFLRPAVKDGIFEIWVDRHMVGGADWDPEIERKLRECDIFILLVSANSMASDYIVDREIAIIRERQANGEDVHFYPLLLTPTPKAGLEKVNDKNLRPRDAKPFSSFPNHDRMQHMSDAADEVAGIAERIEKRKSASAPPPTTTRPAYVHTTGLPETPYERLVGRAEQLKALDEAWSEKQTNILSLIAEGGAGKSALVNEWLLRMQRNDYRGAETVLGWSFYSQGTKERATSADGFLNWALEKLGIAVKTNSASAKGEAIAEALMNRRILLVLDGVEPLQFGTEGETGRLKDNGLSMLLRRFAATPPASAHGLVVLTSRLPVKDIAKWKDGAAPVIDVEKLSDEAGAALLRDNGVWGTDKELRQATHDFGGHPLALGLLASFLKETQNGDVRRRDHIGDIVGDEDNPRHGHAKRVMESYEKEWLVGRPELLAIMRIVGLFDRPASADCLEALRAEPAIAGLTDAIVTLDEVAWRRAVARLREVRLIAPPDPGAPGALDAHPLVREWFGTRLKDANEQAWKEAHGRLYEHLRDTTKEGDSPTLEQLIPLYQAIAHGCRAGRHQEVLDDIYADRICKRNPRGGLFFFASKMLGALGGNLAAVSWFFETPFETPVGTLPETDKPWVLSEAAFYLRAMGRLAETMPAMRAVLRMFEERQNWHRAAAQASNLSETALLIGNVPDAVESAKTSVAHANRSGDEFQMMGHRTTLADALHAAGQISEAESTFAEAEKRQGEFQPQYPLLYFLQGYRYLDLLMEGGDFPALRDRATKQLAWELPSISLLGRSLVRLALGRVHFGLAATGSVTGAREAARIALARFGQALDGLRAAGSNDHIPRGLLAHAAFRRSIGDRQGAARDLDEAEEIAEPGPMKLHLCDLALERARLAFARIEAFAPLNGLVDDSPPKPELPGEAERNCLRAEAATQIDIAAKLIADCGYHRRDAELAELQDVLSGKRTFASLPIHV